mgnify:CR=1 FL=1
MRFVIVIDTENAAFEDRDAEVARILRDVADRQDEGRDIGTLRDANGNRTGSARYVADSVASVNLNSFAAGE